jgi:predicted enzyme involved in methoxymalonyl-ACP biosynthesis
MSCRVFGRQLEFEAMNIAVDSARKIGIKGFIADYIATPKNNVISALYPSLGFTAVNDTKVTNGAERWFLNLADYATHPSYIARVGVGA